MRRALLVCLLCLSLAACGGLSREEAAQEATRFCHPHQGVARNQSNAFYFHEGEFNVTCQDGTVGAGSQAGQTE